MPSQIVAGPMPSPSHSTTSAWASGGEESRSSCISSALRSGSDPLARCARALLRTIDDERDARISAAAKRAWIFRVHRDRYIVLPACDRRTGILDASGTVGDGVQAVAAQKIDEVRSVLGTDDGQL